MRRNYLIDILRSCSMLWIVCIWHLLGYSSLYSIANEGWANMITIIALGFFLFISGYLLANKYGEEKASSFYKKRITRILPLSWFAILLFPNNASIVEKIYNCLGISPLLGGSLPTMWFIAVLIEFYLLFPLITSKNTKKQLVTILVVYLLYGLINVFVNKIDNRVLMYFPCFAVGCIWGCKHISIGESWVPSNLTRKVLSFFSTSSFCAYLFHRHIMVIMEKTILPDDGMERLVFLYVVCVPVILVSGYYIQVVYNNWIIKKI